MAVEFTTSYTPEQNGVAERLNRTLTTKIRAMLTEAGLPQWLWGEAAYTACYLHNRTPRYYPGYHVATPKEMWTGKKPDLGHLRVFGCVAYAQLAREQRHNKLDSTSIRGIFVGYTLITRQYRVYNPENGTIERYSTVRFDEERKAGTLLDPSGNIPPWTEAGDTQGQDTQGWDSTLPDGDTITGAAGRPWGTDTTSIAGTVAGTVTVTIPAGTARAHARRWRNASQGSDPQWEKISNATDHLQDRLGNSDAH